MDTAKPQNAETPITNPVPAATGPANAPAMPPEAGGPKGLEPTRYGDWERKGKCVDF